MGIKKNLKTLDIFGLILFNFASFAFAENFYPSSVFDSSGSLDYVLDDDDLSRLTFNDEVVYETSQSVWGEGSFVEFSFAPDAENDLEVEEVKLTVSWKRNSFMTFIGNSSFFDSNLEVYISSRDEWISFKLNSPGEDSINIAEGTIGDIGSYAFQEIDLTNFVFSRRDIENLKVRYFEPRNVILNRSVYFDFVELYIDYVTDETAPVCSVDKIVSLDGENQFLLYGSDLSRNFFSLEDYFTVYGSASDTSEVRFESLQASRYSDDSNAKRSWNFEGINFEGEENGVINWSKEFSNDGGRSDFYYEGYHEICCKVEDESGNEFDGKCKNFCVDVSKPEGPNAIAPVILEDCSDAGDYSNSSCVEFSWDLATDEPSCGGIDYYQITVFDDERNEVASYLANSEESSTEICGLENGSYSATIYAFDLAGHVGDAVSTDKFFVDLESPQISIISPKQGSWFNSNFDVDVDVSDDNLKSCAYKISNNGKVVLDWTDSDCGSSINVNVDGVCPADGTCTVYFKAKDNACNEDTKYKWFKVDRTVPETNLTLSEPKVDGDLFGWLFDFFINNQTEISLSCSDAGVGCNKTYYRISDGIVQTEWLVYNSKIVFEEEGFYEIEYYSTDLLGNFEDSKNLSFSVDNKAPETSRKIDGDYFDGEDSWMNCSSESVYSCFDSGIGCNYTEEKVVCENGELENSGCEALVYSWRGVDLLGNIEDWKSETNYRDCAGPELNFVTPSDSTDRCVMDVVIDALDFGVGINESTVYARLKNSTGEILSEVVLTKRTPMTSLEHEGASFFSGLFNLDGLSSGNYILEVFALDLLGNKAVVSKEVYLNEGVFVEYISPSRCLVDTNGGNCTFTFNACVRGSNAVEFYMDGINDIVDPFLLYSNISANGKRAWIGWMKDGEKISTAKKLMLTEECDELNGMTTFDLNMYFGPEIVSAIGQGPYSLEYNVNSFNECSLEI